MTITRDTVIRNRVLVNLKHKLSDSREEVSNLKDQLKILKKSISRIFEIEEEITTLSIRISRFYAIGTSSRDDKNLKRKLEQELSKLKKLVTKK